MHQHFSAFKFLSLLFISIFPFLHLSGQVKVVQTQNGYKLMRNGTPYYIKGAGGEGNLDILVKIGGNSVRTWGTEHAQEILDDAQKHGLTVMLGLWLQTERQGFDYDNEEKVENQLKYMKSVIDKFKDHPALLFWGIGNELDLLYSNVKCWKAVQDIAAYIHQIDPNHPTSTVTAGLDSTEVRLIKTMAPDIDIYGVNTYGDIGNVPAHIKKYGWDKPYVITEWGMNGYWESPKTNWDVSIEQTSSEKKQVYFERYTKFIEPYSANCLGSYAFFWGSKQEYTETWFGLFTKNNQPTEALDALESVFLKKNSEKPAPTISRLSLNNQTSKENIRLQPGTRYPIEVVAGIGISVEKIMPDTDKVLNYHWKVLKESDDKRSGGDAEAEAQTISGVISKKSNPVSVLRAPAESGAYRLFVTVEHNGKIAYGNIPFYVEPVAPGTGQLRLFEFKKTDMNSFRQ